MRAGQDERQSSHVLHEMPQIRKNLRRQGSATDLFLQLLELVENQHQQTAANGLADLAEKRVLERDVGVVLELLA